MFCAAAENRFGARAFGSHLLPSKGTETMKLNKSLIALVLLLGSISLSGCVAAAVGAAYVGGEELNENDGDFDPLDEIVDG